MTTPLLLGALLGLGLWLVARGAAATAPPLRAEIEQFHLPEVEGGSWWRVLVGRLLGGPLRPRRTLDADLAVVGTPIERHLLDKLAWALMGGGIPVVLGILTTAAGVAPFLGLLVLTSLALIVVGFLLPDLSVRRRATERRREFRAALSAYVNVVTIVLAGGGGIETALDAAATSSAAWPFQRIRAVLAQSVPSWSSYSDCTRASGSPCASL